MINRHEIFNTPATSLITIHQGSEDLTGEFRGNERIDGFQYIGPFIRDTIHTIRHVLFHRSHRKKSDVKDNLVHS